MSMILVLGGIGIQAFLLWNVRVYVTEDAVDKIQKAYTNYELHMYGMNKSHVTLTYGGQPRGAHEFFNVDNFESLNDHLKGTICAVPLSQPLFFLVVILLWTLTCISQVKGAVEMFARLVVNLPTLDAMADVLRPDEDGSDFHIIEGLTKTLKVSITLLVILPRIAVTCFLLWLGCRWLAATTSFSDTIQNAVALEFVLLIKDMLYATVVPDRSKRELQNTGVRTPWKTESASYMSLLGTFMWGLAALLWCWLYIHVFQAVLPEYNWDVRRACADWNKQRWGH